MTLTELIPDGELRAKVENLLSQMVQTAVEAKDSEKQAALDAAEEKRLADIAAKEAEVEAERLAKEEALKPEKQKRIEALEKSARDAQAEADRLKAEVGEVVSEVIKPKK